MTEHFYHFPDETIFHGIAKNPKGFSFAECRALANEEERIKKLQERLNGYYANGLKEINHPFTIAILTCVGIEVLGQVMLGFDEKGETIRNNTIVVYEMLDPKMKEPLTEKFKKNYNRNRNIPGQNVSYSKEFPTYAHVIRKGLRNSFTHTYRSLGIVQSDSQQEMMEIDEDQGKITVNPFIFRQKYIECYTNCFEKALSNSEPTYRKNALKYLDLLLR